MELDSLPRLARGEVRMSYKVWSHWSEDVDDVHGLNLEAAIEENLGRSLTSEISSEDGRHILTGSEPQETLALRGRTILSGANEEERAIILARLQ